jgi:probable HAF family extracellular repeat protein
MRTTRWTLAWVLVSAVSGAGALPAAGLEREDGSRAVADVYVADFVATAATGAAMNDRGDVAGTSRPDTGCGPFCLPPLETVVWRGGARIVLPHLPGYTGVYVRGINNNGWVAGVAGFPYTQNRAVVWKPSGSSSAPTYEIVNLGVLPGTTTSEALGIDDLGRVVGWSTTSSFPPNGAPFVWTEATGMVDLSAQGFPDEPPLAISPGGTVATASAWYRLGDPSSVSFLPPAPPSFAVGSYATAINDAGDQARFLVNIGPENLVYLYRFHHDDGTWQILSSAGTGHLSTYGVGSINASGDVSATVQSTAVIAPGPDGLAEPLADRLSPAYAGGGLVSGGPMNASGQILARVMIGNSPRLMRLRPGSACEANCTVVSDLQMTGVFVQDPSDPGHCTPEGEAYNLVTAEVTATDEAGAPLPGVLVRGRFLDDYWTDKKVAGTTNANGIVNFVNQGPCGVGAVAFLVDSARARQRAFDRTTGIVTDFVIPH